MKKSLSLGPILILLCSACYNSGFIYYQEVLPDEPLQGQFQLVSCQLRKTPVHWSRTTSNSRQITTHSYSVPFDDPLSFYEKLQTRINLANWQKWKISKLPQETIDNFLNSDWMAFTPYTAIVGMIPVIDDSRQHNQMESSTLTFLNEHFNADYYVIFDGDIIDYEIPMIFNFFEFSLEIEVSLVVYDAKGQKKLARHYASRYTRIPDDYKNGYVYYDYLNRTVDFFASQINADLELLLPVSRE